jgi:hypothetical protein
MPWSNASHGLHGLHGLGGYIRIRVLPLPIVNNYNVWGLVRVKTQWPIITEFLTGSISRCGAREGNNMTKRDELQARYEQVLGEPRVRASRSTGR